MKERRFQRHLHVQVPRRLLFGSFDVVQQDEEPVDVRSLGVSLQVGKLVEMKDLIPISLHHDDDEITDPSRKPRERFFAAVGLGQAFRCQEHGRNRRQAFRPHQRQAFVLSCANIRHVHRERFPDTAIGEDSQKTGIGRRQLPLEYHGRFNLRAGWRRETECLAT